MNRFVENMSGKLILRGFKKSSLTWRKPNGSLIYIVNIQKSRFNVSEERFTINVGVFSSEVFELCWSKKSENPKEYESVFRQRISYFMGSSTDKWWELSSEKEVATIAEEVQIIIDNKVLPFFADISTKEKLAAFMLQLTPPKQDDLYILQLAALLYVTNNKTQGLELLSTIKSESIWREKADELISKIND